MFDRAMQAKVLDLQGSVKMVAKAFPLRWRRKE